MGGGDGVGPATGSGPDHPAWARLVDQLNWYDRKSVAAQRAFRRVKVSQVVIAAAVPVVAAVRGPAWITAVLGSAVVVIEAVQQLYLRQTNWCCTARRPRALHHAPRRVRNTVGWCRSRCSPANPWPSAPSL